MLSITNGAAIEAEIAWFTQVLDLRFRIHGGEVEEGDILSLAPPPPLSDSTPYGAGAGALAPPERLVLILALLPHLRPQALDSFLIPNSQSGRPFTEFGGATAPGRSGFTPTRETALFLLAGESMDRRLEAMSLFDRAAPLHSAGVLELPAEPGEAGPWAALTVSPAWLGRLTTGAPLLPLFGPAFPAQEISTALAWEDLVLTEAVLEELEDLVTWARTGDRLLDEWNLRKHLKPGYRALFHGPPGTGKTVTAAVLGKRLERPVYRVDLSRVVSKWIGETEKNLAALFDHAAEGGMILLFDEADALFGKRGDAKSANDRHANQQIAYLLQRIEDCPGLVILASNLRANIDEAFARRFQALVHFPAPNAAARLALWRKLLRPPVQTGTIADLERLAAEFELTGSQIVNAVRRVAVQSGAGERPVTYDLVAEAVRREQRHGGRIETSKG